MNVWGRSLRLHIPLKDIFFDALFQYCVKLIFNRL